MIRGVKSHIGHHYLSFNSWGVTRVCPTLVAQAVRACCKLPEDSASAFSEKQNVNFNIDLHGELLTSLRVFFCF
jgi:hypothetical protein